MPPITSNRPGALLMCIGLVGLNEELQNEPRNFGNQYKATPSGLKYYIMENSEQ